MSGEPYSTLEVDLGAYAHNLRYVRDQLPSDCKLIAVVKADAYGLGAERISARALKTGADMLGVATADEGIALREVFPEARILVLYQPPMDRVESIVRHALRVTLNDYEAAERLGELARKAQVIVPVHCEVDTGMGRQGFALENAVENIQQLTRISNIDIEGVMTHFPDAELADAPFAQNQIKVFRTLLRDMGRAGIPWELAHMANSAGIVNYPDSLFNMVRPGLMTYGVWPAETRPAEIPLQPVVRWESRIATIRPLPGGASIGYGRTFRTAKPSRTAVVLVGYADGYRHGLGNQAEVIIRGTRCPVVGRVSMDAIVVDVTQLREAAQGDKVTLIGTGGDESISVEDLAAWANTIPYEILTGIGNRVERRYPE